MRRSRLWPGLLLGALIVVAQPTLARDIRLSTTTSTESSGLLKALLPAFELRHGVKVHVISVGTGKALELGKNGDVDVVLVHARTAEDKFVADGHGVNRRDVMYNDFILVGAQEDPLALRGSHDVIAAFRKLGEGHSKFISRGDNSGTDVMEKSYWKAAGIAPKGVWFISAGLGMGEVLTMAGEMKAYTLSDRATYGAYRAKTGLGILVQGDPKMYNPYGIIAVSPKKYPDINYEGAMKLIEWITSPEGQGLIAGFKVNGEQLFFPTSGK